MDYFVGVMSGTSLDGIDIVLVEHKKGSYHQLLASHTYPFSPQLKIDLATLIKAPHCDLKTLGELDIRLGKAISAGVNELVAMNTIDKQQITAIGSHGQTLFHQPEGDNAFSLQIGNPNVIAELTGISTVADFRQRDMVLSGQGAPLVPAFHQNLFQHTFENRVIVNIGGISNMTVLPAKQNDNQPIIGFDAGPGNTLLDAWFQTHNQAPYDHNGQWATTGTIEVRLLEHLLDDDYFRKLPPKSTGREYFNDNWLNIKLADFQHLSAQTVQATLSCFTAQCIANDIMQYAPETDAVYICGGGVHNAYLMQCIQQSLLDLPIATTSALGLHEDWVEACAFAWLADQTLSKKTGNLPEVTGAKRSTILGGIYWSNDAS
jgi:anhydro-N-acetylmuramic acid kinase